MLPDDETVPMWRAPPRASVYMNVNEEVVKPVVPTGFSDARFRRTTLWSIVFGLAFFGIAAALTFLLLSNNPKPESDLFDDYEFRVSDRQTPQPILDAFRLANITYLEGGAPTRLCGSFLWVFKFTKTNHFGEEKTLWNCGMSVNVTKDGTISSASFLRDSEGAVRPLIPRTSNQGSDHIIEPVGTGAYMAHFSYLFWEVITLNNGTNSTHIRHNTTAPHSHKAFGKGKIACDAGPSLKVMRLTPEDEPSDSPIPVATFEYTDGYMYTYLIQRPQPYGDANCGSVSVHAARIKPENLTDDAPKYEYWTGRGDSFSSDITMRESPHVITNWTRGSSVSIRWNPHLHHYCILITKNGTSVLHFAKHPWTTRHQWSKPVIVKGSTEDPVSEAFFHPELWSDQGSTMVISLKSSAASLPQMVHVEAKKKFIREENLMR
ncbi:hypothetical protein PROFUN_01303 [Planoprotostelium fungivorum]|uniref:Uncharacterized protein n=1 Tax=Planoprotostelium fungivorum TaxID=1890364 RepID=A0A2P6NZR2_9EUKA|nr:hypothetical protein PROFUN_01303 [Planoprotostelium fungivorum]